MAHFCSPLATLPKVAKLFLNHPQITFPATLHKTARTFLLEPADAQRGMAKAGEAAGSLTLIFDDADHARPTQLYVDRMPVPSRSWPSAFPTLSSSDLQNSAAARDVAGMIVVGRQAVLPATNRKVGSSLPSRRAMSFRQR